MKGARPEPTLPPGRLRLTPELSGSGASCHEGGATPPRLSSRPSSPNSGSSTPLSLATPPAPQRGVPVPSFRLLQPKVGVEGGGAGGLALACGMGLGPWGRRWLTGRATLGGVAGWAVAAREDTQANQQGCESYTGTLSPPLPRRIWRGWWSGRSSAAAATAGATAGCGTVRGGPHTQSAPLELPAKPLPPLQQAAGLERALRCGDRGEACGRSILRRSAAMLALQASRAGLVQVAHCVPRPLAPCRRPCGCQGQPSTVP